MEELLGWSLDGALDPWSCFKTYWKLKTLTGNFLKLIGNFFLKIGNF